MPTSPAMTMNTSHESLKHWLSGVLTDGGVYGATADRPAVFEPDRDPRHATRPKLAQRLSCVVATGRLTVSGGAAKTDVRVTVKLKPPVEQLRTVLRADGQFCNEIHAYQNVVPFLVEHLRDGARAPAMPAFVYGRGDGDARWPEDVIVLQDPLDSGYAPARAPEPSPSHAITNGMHMDYDHLAVAIAALGRFHGMSLTAKQKNPVAFRKLISKLREIQWDSDGVWLVKSNGLKSLSMRGVRPLMEQEQYRDGKLQGFLNIIREADRNLKLAMAPKEPLAVICHGDYCKPNILFSYDGSGQPQDAMITEFTAVRYGSPGLDLSYFLYKNADQDVQNNRWEDLLTVYLDSLVTVLPSDVKAPTIEKLHSELRFHAFYGYAHLLFAVPNMINDNPRDFLDVDNENTTVEDLLVTRLDSADAKIQVILTAAVKHMVDHGYAQQYEFSSNSR